MEDVNHSPTEVALPVAVPASQDSWGRPGASDPLPDVKPQSGAVAREVPRRKERAGDQPGGDRADVVGDRQLGGQNHTDHRPHSVSKR
jgi:hypothetical protein